jgi:hypothetical protein
MPTAEAALGNGAVAQIVVDGPAWQLDIPQNTGTVSTPGTITVPGTIGSLGTWNSALIQANGMPHLAASAEINQAGTFGVQRFLDAGGAIPTGTLISTAMNSGTLAVIDNNDGRVFQSFTLEIVNGSASPATPIDVAVVLQSR